MAHPVSPLLLQRLQVRRILDPVSHKIIVDLNLYSVEIARTSPIYGKYVNRELRGVRFKINIGHGQSLS